MLQFKSLRKPIAVAMALLMVIPPVIGASSDHLGVYDFGYGANGDDRVRPVQVFDDGRFTYFQFKAGEPIPAIFAEGSNGPVLVVPQIEGPYIKVAVVAASFQLRLGYGTGRVGYMNGARTSHEATAPAPPAVKVPSSLGRLNEAAKTINATYREPPKAKPILQETDSYATPIKGDVVQWTDPGEQSSDYSISFPMGKSKLLPTSIKALMALLPSKKANMTFEVVGRDDDTYMEGLPDARSTAVAEFLIAHGVSRDNIRIKSGVPVQGEASAKNVTGVTLRWSTPPTVRPPIDPTQATLASLMARKITPAEAIAALQAQHNSAYPQPIQAPVEQITWQIRKSDATLQAMLKRWAINSGWTVEWKDAPEVKINRDITVNRAEFITAADYVISQAKAVGYHIKASAYSNNVLVVSEDKSK
jgi:outer membrane protein OmpA-like peptidoglycan-associated protein